MKINLPTVIDSPPSYSQFEETGLKGFQLKLYYKVAVAIYLRTVLSESQNHRCCWCGINTTEIRDKSNSATIEHVQPRSKGGENVRDNMAMSCYNCNQKRGNTDAELFILKLSGIHVIEHSVQHPSRKYTKEEVAEFRRYGYSTSPNKIKKRRAQLAARKALELSNINPFEINSAEWKFFNRYSNTPEKLSNYMSTH